MNFSRYCKNFTCVHAEFSGNLDRTDACEVYGCLEYFSYTRMYTPSSQIIYYDYFVV